MRTVTRILVLLLTIGFAAGCSDEPVDTASTQQEILRVCSEMEESMGEGFDLAAFHAAVLESGSLPLALLEDVVAESVMGE